MSIVTDARNDLMTTGNTKISISSINEDIDTKSNTDVKVIIHGVDEDADRLYLKLYGKTKQDKHILYINNFSRFSVDSTSNVNLPMIKKDNKNYLIQTFKNFIECADSKTRESLIETFVEQFEKDEYKGYEILRNKANLVVSVINSLCKDNANRVVLYNGKFKDNERIIFSILAKATNLGIIICDADKKIKIADYEEIELSNTNENYRIDQLKTVEASSTIASRAEQQVNNILYSDNQLGMYKNDQLTELEVINYKTTYDEIKLWWTNEAYLRPGFESKGPKVKLPTIFDVVYGLNDDNTNLTEVKELTSKADMVILNTKDIVSKIIEADVNKNPIPNSKISGAMYLLQNSKSEEDKVNSIVQIIDESQSYYNILTKYKKQSIARAILRSINRYDRINSTDEMLEALTLGLMLHKDVIKILHSFQYNERNPKLVVVYNESLGSDVEAMTKLLIVSRILRELGFDVVWFVLSGYRTLDSIIKTDSQEKTNINEYNLSKYLYFSDDVPIRNIIEKEVENKEKGGFFKRIFK